MSAPDPIQLSQDLIRHESVTPDQGGALRLLATELEALGFWTEIVTFAEEGTDPVPNLYARLGTESPVLGFAGHTDVVPAGTLRDWTVDPFAAEIKDGQLWGRGAADMKAAIACFTSACARVLADREASAIKGSIAFLITGDEEGPAVNGTVKLLEWMEEKGEKLDLCIVGEPTNPQTMGEMIKIGRRGSLHGHLVVNGVQGHVAYPHRAHNPIPDLIKLLDALISVPLDDGNDHFQPSNLEVIDMHVGNQASNVIPAKAEARFNIRFSSEYSPESLCETLTQRLDAVGLAYDITWLVSGDSFLTPPGDLSDAISDAVEKRLGRRPELSSTGGTSDARFIKNMCPVVEFGLVGETMHKTDEHVALADIEALTDIYQDVILRLLGSD